MQAIRLYAGTSAHIGVPQGNNLQSMQTISREDLEAISETLRDYMPDSQS